MTIALIKMTLIERVTMHYHIENDSDVDSNAMEDYIPVPQTAAAADSDPGSHTERQITLYRQLRVKDFPKVPT